MLQVALEKGDFAEITTQMEPPYIEKAAAVNIFKPKLTQVPRSSAPQLSGTATSTEFAALNRDAAMKDQQRGLVEPLKSVAMRDMPLDAGKPRVVKQLQLNAIAGSSSSTGMLPPRGKPEQLSLARAKAEISSILEQAGGKKVRNTSSGDVSDGIVNWNMKAFDDDGHKGGLSNMIPDWGSEMDPSISSGDEDGRESSRQSVADLVLRQSTSAPFLPTKDGSRAGKQARNGVSADHGVPLAAKSASDKIAVAVDNYQNRESPTPLAPVKATSAGTFTLYIYIYIYIYICRRRACWRIA